MDLHSRHLNYISLCTGGGGLDLGLELAIPSARAICYVEREAFACSTLVQAIRDGKLASAPIWTDASSFDGRPWRGVVDCLIGGIPCQPHSLAGRKRGRHDERDLWTSTRRIISQARPWIVLIENVGGMLSAGADEIAGAERVRRDLHRLGFAVEGGLFTAAEVGAPHQRERVFILGVADAASAGRREGITEAEISGWRPELNGADCDVVHSTRERRREGRTQPEFQVRDGAATYDAGSSMAYASRHGQLWSAERDSNALRPEFEASLRDDIERRDYPLFPPEPGDADAWREIIARAPHLEPAVRRVADGLAGRVDQLRMLGNGVVPLEAAHAIRTLVARLAAAGSPGATILAGMMEEIE